MILKHIIKTIEIYTKCPATRTARKYGTQYTTENWTDENGQQYTRQTYGDGTSITYKHQKRGGGIPIMVKLPDGTEIPSIDEIAYEHFQHQKDIIISRYGEGTYEMFKKYSDLLDGNVGRVFNSYKYGGKDMNYVDDKLTLIPSGQGKEEKIRENYEKFQYLKENQETYDMICQTNDLRSYGNFFTWTTIMPAEKDYELGKRIVTLKQPRDETVGTVFENNEDKGGTYPQYIITIRQQDNPANMGAFTGNALNEYRKENNNSEGTWDWKQAKSVKDKDYMKRIHTVPGQKFENIIIDEVRLYAKPFKTVVRKPYDSKF